MILVNAANLASGGALTILENFYRYAPKNSIFLIKNKELKKYLIKARPNGPELIIIPAWTKKPYFLFLYYYYWINNFSKKNGVNEIISLGNIATKTKINQKLYIHWPYFAYGLNIGKNANLSTKVKRYFRYFFIYFFSRYANTWIVQTDVMVRKISEKKNSYNKKIIKIYPGINKINSTEIKSTFNKKEIINLIYPSLYYSHKNFESLFNTGKSIDYLNLPYKISLTLPVDIFNSLGFNKLSSIQNLGVLGKDELHNQYLQHDALIMPTKLETFGLPYIEAMTYSLPILTSDKDFSREICSKYAIYFDPDNSDSIINSIKELQKQLNEGKDFYKHSQNQLSKFPSWEESVTSIFS